MPGATHVTSDQILLFGLFAAVFALLLWGRWRYDLVAFTALVIEGSFSEGGETFAKNSWLRLPPGTPLDAVAGAEGARLWVKSGHLAVPPSAPNV